MPNGHKCAHEIGSKDVRQKYKMVLKEVHFFYILVPMGLNRKGRAKEHSRDQRIDPENAIEKLMLSKLTTEISLTVQSRTLNSDRIFST